jgi:hypothetical protein
LANTIVTNDASIATGVTGDITTASNTGINITNTTTTHPISPIRENTIHKRIGTSILDHQDWPSVDQVDVLLYRFKSNASFLLSSHYGLIIETIFSHKEWQKLSTREPPTFRSAGCDNPSNGWQVIAVDWFTKATKNFLVGNDIMELVRRNYYGSHDFLPRLIIRT